MSLALERAGLDPDVHVVVITGAGDQAFSAGADIDEFPTRQLVDGVANKARRRPHETIRVLPKPVVAMVNGLALGGGCELVLAADLAVAADTAKFGQPEIRVGVIPGCGGTQVLPRLMGEKRAKEFIFTGRMMDAEEALGYGIVNRVVPFAELRGATEKLVSDLLRNSPAILKIAEDGRQQVARPAAHGRHGLRAGALRHVLRHGGPEGRRQGVLREAQAGVHREIGARLWETGR